MLPNLPLTWAKTLKLDSIQIAAMTGVSSFAIYLLLVLVAVLSIGPVKNLFSRRQMMNASFEPFHLVNTYGAFGSITRIRNEIIIEGSYNPATGDWQEYGFFGKPGEVDRLPPLVAPYHYRLDWQMWFAAMDSYQDNPWILSFVGKLLSGNKQVLGLIRKNPFSKNPPKYIRAQLYEYHFTDWGEKNWWKRTFVRPYLPPLSLDDPQFRQILTSQGWLDE